jgi:hypothetical protein
MSGPLFMTAFAVTFSPLAVVFIVYETVRARRERHR